MRFLRRGTFLGGTFLSSQKEETFDSPIQGMSIPRCVRVPLSCSGGAWATPIAGPGDRVERDQCVAKAEDGNLTVHAPADGTVIGRAQAITVEGMRVSALEIETDPNDRAPIEPKDDAKSLPAPAVDELFTVMGARGVVGGQGGVSPDTEGTPLAALLRGGRRERIKHLIINAAESEPYLTAAHRVLVDHARDVVTGAQALARVLNNARCWLSVDRDDRLLAKRLQRLWRSRPGNRPGIRVRAVVNKYPACSPRLLVHALLGRHVPAAGSSLDVGAFVLDVRAVQALGAALRRGEPGTSVTVTVSGELMYRPGNYRIAVGTPVEHVLSAGRADLNSAHVVVAGGPLTGRRVDDFGAVISHATRAILVLPTAEPAPPPTACVRCGWCLDDCPAGLDPLALMNQADTGTETGQDLHPEACIGCGICSFVCPSRLAIMPSVLSLREKQLGRGSSIPVPAADEERAAL